MIIGRVLCYTVLNHDGGIPDFVDLTEAKVHDSRISKILQLAKGSTVVFDRGCNGCRWFDELTREGVFFVTRLKSNAAQQQIGARAIRPCSQIKADHVIKAVRKKTFAETALRWIPRPR